ncbi:MAG: polyprenol phosphomannose-dependent alpha 1,6 mannosyltransferase MptB [Flavobacteriaceae bacterium]
MDLSTGLMVKIGLVFRLIILISAPNLSQDFYRFFWDGQLILNGFNPYLNTPNEIIISKLISFPKMNEIYELMGSLSQNNYSNYPPIHQIITFITLLITDKSIIASIISLRLILILFDLGILFYGIKLLKILKKPKNIIFIYFLNPLVILELIGNLHLEGVMVFFMILSFYHLYRKSEIYSGIFLGLSILTKLIPLIILPLFLFRLGLKKSIRFIVTITAVISTGFAPFINFKSLINYSESINLWFSNFEFNASIYYALKEIFKVFNIRLIDYMVYIIPISIFIVLTYLISIKKNKTQDILTQSLIILTTYLFISTTIHPWYIIPLIFLSCFTNYRYPIFWSFTIFLSYFSYYEIQVNENHFLLAIEYGLVIGILFYEIYFKKLNHHKLTDFNF